MITEKMHRNVLRTRTAEKAAHAYAPQENTEFAPVITTNGQSYEGRNRLIPEDILALKERFDNMDVPLEDRYLVLHPSHVSDLIVYDIKAFKDITDIINGVPKRFIGFNILQFSRPAFYSVSSLEKLAYAAVPGTGDSFCSFAFHKDEVMKADGNVFMCARENDPEQRGTIVGFDKRFIAVPIRNKAIGAIVSAIGQASDCLWSYHADNYW